MRDSNSYTGETIGHINAEEDLLNLCGCKSVKAFYISEKRIS